jgi:hypothetical protein
MRLTKTLAGLAGALLVAFHGWLLALQFADGRLVEPWQVLRWIIAAGLVAGLVAVRWQGSSIFSRKSVAIWALAASLHGPSVAAAAGAPLDSPAHPDTLATLVLLAVSSGVLALGLSILARRCSRSDRRPPLASRPALAFAAVGILAASFSPPFSPRPPPRA